LLSDQRRPHPTNIVEGTADDYMWKVYGLGERCAPEGLVFDVRWIDAMPDDITQVYYGSDVGQTNSPSVVVRVAIDRKAKPGHSKPNMYLECLAYRPTPNPNDYVDLLKPLNITKPVWGDSAAPMFLVAAQEAGMKVYGVKKGLIVDGISLMKNYNIHVIRNEFKHYVAREVDNYKYRVIRGIKLEDPIDDFNHFWDASRYAVIANL
jgi:phage terminase large subunit